MSRPPRARVALRLRIDPVACDGVGLCAQLADRTIALDRWGYPILAEDLDRRDVADARRAVRACPRHALWLEEATPQR